MPSDQTRTAILAAAERLYADRGFGDVTLRDIVAEANVNLAAVNYHFGSKDELIAELFVTRSLALNKERLRELREAEEAGNGRADVSDVLRALVGPTLRGCLGPENQRSTPARFMIRVSIESVPAIRRIRNREIDHLRKFIAAMKRSLPDRSEVELYWGLHFALAMAQQTVRDSERLTKLSEGKCDVDNVEDVIARVGHDVEEHQIRVMQMRRQPRCGDDWLVGGRPPLGDPEAGETHDKGCRQSGPGQRPGRARRWVVRRRGVHGGLPARWIPYWPPHITEPIRSRCQHSDNFRNQLGARRFVGHRVLRNRHTAGRREPA